MSGPVLRLRTRSWHADIEQDFRLPDGWTADVAEPAGAPALEPGAVTAAFDHPIDAPTLDEFARLLPGKGWHTPERRATGSPVTTRTT